jgi:hypothetical protein
MISVPAGETAEIELLPEEYTVLVESGDKELLAFMGTLIFEEFRKYTEIFEDYQEETSS